MPRLIDKDLRSDLEKLRAGRLYRRPDVFPSKKSPKKIGRFVDFSSNDYLGLSQHPRVIAAAARAAKKWGSGSAASRLLSGNLDIHRRLEERLADFKRQEAATVFSSGYLANLGALSTLTDEKDVILLDRLSHASLVDGARLSKAKLWVYPHKDTARLDELLERADGFRRKLVVTDAYFSMDGDLAPLPELTRVCRKRGAMLLIDEAHSTGVFGRGGRGVVEYFGLSEHPDIVMGTLSKALGSLGGFIAGSAALKETLVNRCRTFIYTTAPTPPSSAAALEALAVVESAPALRNKLWDNVRALREGLQELGLDTMDSKGPIVPLRVGEPDKTMRIKEALQGAGYYVSAIRPPTVPVRKDRVRLSVSAAHTGAQIAGLLASLKKNRKLFP